MSDFQDLVFFTPEATHRNVRGIVFYDREDRLYYVDATVGGDVIVGCGPTSWAARESFATAVNDYLDAVEGEA